MNIAIVSGTPIFPVIAGNRLRILRLVQALKALGHVIHFVYLPLREAGEVDLAAHADAFGRCRLTVLKRNALHDAAHYSLRAAHKAIRKCMRVAGYGSAAYYSVDGLYYGGFTAQLRALQSREKFDAVIVEYVHFSLALSAFPAGVLKIIDAHDNIADRHMLFPGRKNVLSLTANEQCRGFRRADVVLAIQNAEAELFRTHLGAGSPVVRVVSHMLDVSRPVVDYAPIGVTFVGTAQGIAGAINAAALSEFLQYVVPAVVAEIPAFRLLVAGGAGAAIADDPRVTKLGYVENIIEAYRQAPVAVNPVTVGTGVSTRTLEAMAAGVPVVATETGCRGIGAEFLGGITVVPDGDHKAFAVALVNLLRSQDLRHQLGRAALAAAGRWNMSQTSALQEVLNPKTNAEGDRPDGKTGRETPRDA